MTKKTTLEDLSLEDLKQLKDLTKNAKKMGEIISYLDDMPLSLHLTWAIQHEFWKMLDKDFGHEVDNESIHQIFKLLFGQLDEKQLINILNAIDPKGLSKILNMINELKKNE